MILEDIARWTLPKICLPFEVSLVLHFGLDFFAVSVVKFSLTSGRPARKIVAFDETIHRRVKDSELLHFLQQHRFLANKKEKPQGFSLGQLLEPEWKIEN